MSALLWCATFVGVGAAVLVVLQLFRPDVAKRAHGRGSELAGRLVPLNNDRALRLIAGEAVRVLDTPTGRTATGINVTVSRPVWELIQPGAAVQRVRNAAAELNPPHPTGARLLVRLVPSDRLVESRVLVTTVRTTSVGTRVLGASDIPVALEGSLELVPLVNHLGHFVLPPNVTLVLGSEGDLRIPGPSAERYGVSRAHVALTCIDGVLEISDLDSTNHVYVNGRLEPATAVAEPGSELACGNARWMIAERQVEQRQSFSEPQR
jgi:hypothetical protein